MNGRRVYHARGKLLGGSSSINGMIFQRGNPMDFERWARPARARALGLRPLPAVLQADGDVPRRRRRVARGRRAARPRARPRDEPALRRVLRGGAAGRVLAHRRRERRAPGGVRRLRPEHPPRPPPERRARVPAPGAAPAESRRADACLRHPRPLRRVTRDRRRGRAPGEDRGGARRRGDPLRRRDQLAAAPPALGRRERRRAARGRRRRRPRPAGRRREPAGPPRGLRAARLDAAGLGRARDEVAQPAVGRVQVAVLPVGAGRDEPLRGRRLRPLERRGDAPEPDVPLPPARDPLRRLAAGRRPRLPGARRPDVLRRPRLGEDHVGRIRA